MLKVRVPGYLYRPKYRSASGEQREAGFYWWKYKGRRCSTGCRDLDQAKEWAYAQALAMREGRAPTVPAKPLDYGDLERLVLERWELEQRRGYDQARCALKHLRRHFAGWSVGAITSSAVTKYMLEKKQAGYSSAYVNLHVAILRRAFSVAQEAYPSMFIPKMPRLKGVNHRTGTVNPAEFETILARMPERYRGVCRFLHLTGWRESEGLGLLVSRVDLDNLEIRLDDSKTHEPRLVAFPFDSQLAEVLRAAILQRKSLSPFVFPGRGGKRLDRTALQKAWRKACDETGVGRKYIHDMRRSMVSDLSRAGVPLKVAMEQVGHRSLTVHQGYRVVGPEEQRAAIARVEAARGEEPKERKVVSIDERRSG